MEGDSLLNKLNGYPTPPLAPQSSAEVYQVITAISELFQRVDLQDRRSITARLGRSAKYWMFEYSQAKAIEGRRTGSRTAIIAGLVPVVMAGGRSDTVTGGTLLSMLLRSAEKSGLSTQELFEYAAEFASDEETAKQVRGFPRLPPGMRDMRRYGVLERKTPEGVIYEHAVESLFRPRWWDKLLRRRRVSREEALEVLREFEEDYSDTK